MKKLFKWFGISMAIVLLIGVIGNLINNQKSVKNEVVVGETQAKQDPVQDSLDYLKRIDEFERDILKFSKEQPNAIDAINELQSSFKMLTYNKLSELNTIKLLLDKSRIKLIKTMEKFYPFIRDKFGKVLNEKLYANDMKCEVDGENSDHITFTGFYFAKNQNKLDYQNTSEFNTMLKQYRFTSYTFKSNEYDSGDSWSVKNSDTTIAN